MHLCRRLLHLLAILVALYTFFCSLATLSRGFRLISTSTDGSLPKEHLTNPALGLLIGTIGTAVVQSSSTVTSFLVALVASGSISVKEAIPIVMGSNVGTSLTSGLVAFLHIRTPEKFKIGFTVAIMHDIFNWMTILILLPVECLTELLSKTSHILVESLYQDKQWFNQSLFHTSPLFFLEASVVDNIVKLRPADLPCHLKNSSSIDEAWRKLEQFKSLDTEETLKVLETLETPNKGSCSMLETDCKEGSCSYLFASTDLSDGVIGAIIVVCSLVVFILSYLVLFTSLKNILAEDPTSRNKRIPLMLSNWRDLLTAMLPAYMIDLVFFLAGLLATFVVQSSSGVTSALVPLASSGGISVEGAYSIVAGTNLGTTATGILAALSSDAAHSREALQIALVHCLINAFGIGLFFVIPLLRWPLFCAKLWGSKVVHYKWFSVFYLFVAIILLPLLLVGLSLLNTTLLYIIVTLLTVILVFVELVNYLQRNHPKRLPQKLKTWEFLPIPLRSLSALDFVIQTYTEVFCCCIIDRTVQLLPVESKDVGESMNVITLGMGSNFQLVKIEKK